MCNPRRSTSLTAPAGGPSDIRAAAEAEQLHRELLRHESVLRAINDPYTAEGVISTRALVRLRALAAELSLDAPHVVELAHQAAQILLLMRPQEEEASDFQVQEKKGVGEDRVQFLCVPLAFGVTKVSESVRTRSFAQEYTLIALVAIAAHLGQKQLGDNFGLPMLAARYKQDLQALEQVGSCTPIAVSDAVQQAH